MGRAAITLSTSDPAGGTMLGVLREQGFEETDRDGILLNGDIPLVIVSSLVVPEVEYKTPSEPNPYPADYDGIAASLGIDYYVVASRHWARSGQPSLTVHATGNFGKAVFGGRRAELQFVPPNPMRRVFQAIQRVPPHGFQVSLEATHHSPTQFRTPMFFAEVGSSPRQWTDVDVCRYLVGAILDGLASRDEVPPAIGFGGGHYCPKFSVKERDVAFGHVAAKYAFPELTEELMGQMSVKSGSVQTAFVEDSVKGYDKKKVEVALKKLGIEIVVL